MDFLGIAMDLDNIFRLAKELGFSKEETLWLVMEKKERVRKERELALKECEMKRKEERADAQEARAMNE